MIGNAPVKLIIDINEDLFFYPNDRCLSAIDRVLRSSDRSGTCYDFNFSSLRVLMDMRQTRRWRSVVHSRRMRVSYMHLRAMSTCDHKNMHGHLAWNLRGVVSAVYDLCIKTYSNWRGCGREMLILEFAWLVVSAWQECKILLSASPKISMVVKAEKKRYLTEVNIIYTHSINYIPTNI